jgi:hypothetical protein
VTGQHARQPHTRQLAATLDKLARRELKQAVGARELYPLIIDALRTAATVELT